MTAHVAAVVETAGRYPHVPTCECGWFSRGYLTAEAAQLVADDHVAEEAASANAATEELLARIDSNRAARRRPRNVVAGHSIRWFVYCGPVGEPLTKVPHTSTMRGQWPGWDAECECGWSSNTGGAVKSYVAGEVELHKFEVAAEAGVR